MPEYRTYLSRVVKLVENSFSVRTHLEQCSIIKRHLDGANLHETRLDLETHLINSSHMVMTTLGTAGSRVLESADKFEVRIALVCPVPFLFFLSLTLFVGRGRG